MTKQYGLIGQSLKHSFSKDYFTEFFAKEGIAASYKNFELQRIEDFIGLKKQEILGLNVTLPYKESILPFLDQLSPEAQEIGAVNCICFSEGKTIGHNTDAYGFKESLRPILRTEHRKALILGKGGAAKAVAYVLRSLGVEYRYVSRDPQGIDLAYGDLNDKALSFFPFLINTSPVGMFPDVEACPDIPYEHLSSKNFLYDLIYNPEETLFLNCGKERGALVMNGHKMLIYQAERSWELWNQIK